MSDLQSDLQEDARRRLEVVINCSKCGDTGSLKSFSAFCDCPSGTQARVEAAKWKALEEQERQPVLAEIEEAQRRKKVRDILPFVAPMVPLGQGIKDVLKDPKKSEYLAGLATYADQIQAEMDRQRDLQELAARLERLREDELKEKMDCKYCGDTGIWYRWNPQTKMPEHKACTYCAPKWAERARQRLIAEVNHYWPIDNYALELIARGLGAWDDNRPGATPKTKTAREYALTIIQEMPTPKTLLLIGEAWQDESQALYGVGTGKTWLLAEIAGQARAKGLAAILCTAERARRAVQSIPRDYEPVDMQAKKAAAVERARRLLNECEVLCLDEVGWEAGDKFSEWLLELINTRIGAGLNTCIAGNRIAGKMLLPNLSRLTAANNLFVDLSHDRDARQQYGHGG